MDALVIVPACQRHRQGCCLTTLFGNVESVELKAIALPTPKKRGWLPLLTILFLISYGLMTMLIVEQGQTIESQRALIRELFRDSTELSAVKMKALEEQRAATHNSSSQNPSAQIPSTQIPSTQAPSTQAQTKQAPSTQAETQRRVQNEVKPKYQVPPKPAADLSDHRRALITI
jgi:hypothetical protein